jgi:hypothetical protein
MLRGPQVEAAQIVHVEHSTLHNMPEVFVCCTSILGKLRGLTQTAWSLVINVNVQMTDELCCRARRANVAAGLASLAKDSLLLSLASGSSSGLQVICPWHSICNCTAIT